MPKSFVRQVIEDNTPVSEFFKFLSKFRRLFPSGTRPSEALGLTHDEYVEWGGILTNLSLGAAEAALTKLIEKYRKDYEKTDEKTFDKSASTQLHTSEARPTIKSTR